jgi:hypothetical protein
MLSMLIPLLDWIVLGLVIHSRSQARLTTRESLLVSATATSAWLILLARFSLVGDSSALFGAPFSQVLASSPVVTFFLAAPASVFRLGSANHHRGNP